MFESMRNDIRRRRLDLPALLLVVFTSLACQARSPIGRAKAILNADRIDRATLSPDGRRVAYTKREGTVVSIVVCPVDLPGEREFVFANSGLRIGRRGGSVRVLFLRWLDDTSLIYAVSVPPRVGPFHEEVHAVDVLSHNDRLLADTESLDTLTTAPLVAPSVDGSGDRPEESHANAPVSGFAPRHCQVLGFDGAHPGTILVAALGTPFVETDVYRIDATTAKRNQVGNAPGGRTLLFDSTGQPRILETPRSNVSAPSLMPSHVRGIARLGQPAPAARVVRQFFQYHRSGQWGLWRALDGLPGARGLHFDHADDDFYGSRSIPLGFGADPNLLVFASNVGRDTYGIYALDLTTGRRTPLAVESEEFDLIDPENGMADSPLVLDRQHRLVGVRVQGEMPPARWFDPALERLQERADRRFTGRRVELLDWNESKTRLLLLVSGPGSPGRYFTFDDGPHPTCTEILRSAAELPSEELSPATPFAFTSPSGVELRGIVTVPRSPRMHPPALVVLCPDIPDGRIDTGVFDRPAQAFAAQGLMVLEIAYRGTSGLGIRHRDAFKSGFARIPLSDIRAALDWLAARESFDRRRVALVGFRFGGYVAVRALELFPKDFRCAVSIGGPINPRSAGRAPFQRVAPEPVWRRRAYLNSGPVPVRGISLDQRGTPFRSPALFIEFPSSDDLAAADSKRFVQRLRRAGNESEYVEFPGRGDPSVLRNFRLFGRIAEFLNANVYSYRVNVGPGREVK